MVPTVNSFLDSVHEELREKSEKSHIVIVTGNDSADLDSIISALLFAFLSQQKADISTLFVPLVKVPLVDIALRPEVEFVLGSASIDVKKLVCSDHIDLESLSSHYNKVQVVLVDHNHLTAPFDATWTSRVVGVLDHHVDEGQYQDIPLRVVEMVGSCTSLVIRHFTTFMKQPEYAAKLAKLALSPLLVDTIGLRWDFGKMTQTDMDAFDVLSLFLHWTSSDKQVQELYESIEHIKSNVKHMNTRDLLRKDYKEWFVHGYRIGTSSLPWHLKGWIERDGADSAIEATWGYAKERHLDMEVILTSYDHSKEEQGDSYKRELALFIVNNRLLEVKRALEMDTEIDLVPLLIPYDNAGGRIVLYNQINIKMSRKQIWPLIQSLLSKL
ncbi:hypothetical protein BDF14DRAFT_1883708 [Spinellus fusiger]|nr:hypothetical protein BDF14DRAFT_1883708 [Spinellus fusiger]